MKRIVTNTLARADIRINGNRPWGIHVHNEPFPGPYNQQTCDRVLDTGRGSGGFPKYASSTRGCEVTGVTPSNEQARHARNFTEGLPVDIVLKNLTCGMIEHAGDKNYGSLFLLHTICISHETAAVADRHGKVRQTQSRPGPGQPACLTHNPLIVREKSLSRQAFLRNALPSCAMILTRDSDWGRTMNRGTSGIAAASIAALLVSGCASPFFMGQRSSTKHRPVGERTVTGPFASVETVAVRADLTPLTLTVAGDYGQETTTVAEGAKTGAKAGAAAGAAGAGEAVAEDPRFLVLYPILLPLTAIAGSITGSIAGAAAAKIEQQVQEYRDGLTEDLQAATEAASINDQFASVVNRNLQRNPAIQSRLARMDGDLSADADAVIDLNVSDVIISTLGKNATLRTIVTISITAADGTVLARHRDEYAESDRLSNWANEHDARWSDYQEGAWQYFARRVGRLFDKPITLRHVLRPVENNNKAVLDWELILLGQAEEHAWANAITESNATFDLEIYDGNRLAFSVDGLSESHYAITSELEPCRTYRWTVRPMYHFEGTLRAGEWIGKELWFRHHHPISMPNPGNSASPLQPSYRVIEALPTIKTRCR